MSNVTISTPQSAPRRRARGRGPYMDIIRPKHKKASSSAPVSSSSLSPSTSTEPLPHSHNDSAPEPIAPQPSHPTSSRTPRHSARKSPLPPSRHFKPKRDINSPIRHRPTTPPATATPSPSTAATADIAPPLARRPNNSHRRSLKVTPAPDLLPPPPADDYSSEDISFGEIEELDISAIGSFSDDDDFSADFLSDPIPEPPRPPREPIKSPFLTSVQVEKRPLSGAAPATASPITPPPQPPASSTPLKAPATPGQKPLASSTTKRPYTSPPPAKATPQPSASSLHSFTSRPASTPPSSPRSSSRSASTKSSALVKPAATLKAAAGKLPRLSSLPSKLKSQQAEDLSAAPTIAAPVNKGKSHSIGLIVAALLTIVLGSFIGGLIYFAFFQS